jgi:adenylate kinase
MRIVLLGPPGSGKGTQAKLIEKRLGIPHVSAGDLLRAEVAERSDLGRVAKEFMDRGDLVPDDLVVGMIERRMASRDCEKGFLLDGFPRNVAQARVLDRMLAARKRELDHVVFLRVTRQELMKRLNGRRREDDSEATVRARLEVYEQETAPLCEYYGARGLLRRVDGEGQVDEILDRIVGGFEEAGEEAGGKRGLGS